MPPRFDPFDAQRRALDTMLGRTFGPQGQAYSSGTPQPMGQRVSQAFANPGGMAGVADSTPAPQTPLQPYRPQPMQRAAGVYTGGARPGRIAGAMPLGFDARTPAYNYQQQVRDQQANDAAHAAAQRVIQLQNEQVRDQRERERRMSAPASNQPRGSGQGWSGP